MTTEKSPLTWAPDACTLPEAQQPLRVAEFDELFAGSLLSATRPAATRLHLRLAGPTGLEDTVRDLAARESECCSFFTFTTTAAAPGDVTLDIEVSAEHADVLDALVARATARDERP
jgi:hypothetical protein